MQRERSSSREAIEATDQQTAAASIPARASGSRRSVLRVLPGIAVAAMTGLVLTGCGGGGDDDEDDDDD